jgi:hypothetical protein
MALVVCQLSGAQWEVVKLSLLREHDKRWLKLNVGANLWVTHVTKRSILLTADSDQDLCRLTGGNWREKVGHLQSHLAQTLITAKRETNKQKSE